MIYRPKRCGNNNKDEDNNLKTLNDKKSSNFVSEILTSDFLLVISERLEKRHRHAQLLFKTVSVSSSALFIIPDYLICMRYPRVCVTLCKTKQVQKRPCIAILAFFPFGATEKYDTQPHASPVSHDFSPHSGHKVICRVRWFKQYMTDFMAVLES